LIEVSELTIKDAAGTVPKSTLVVPVNPLPDMTMAVPPAEDPTAGLTFVTTGTADRISEKKHKESKRLKKFLRFMKFPPYLMDLTILFFGVINLELNLIRVKKNF
jgi:hypothetical protein